MLRIEKQCSGCVTRLLLSGYVRSEGLACIQSAINDACAHTVLDLGEVTLVDVAGVRFLMGCEREGVELAQCPPFVREWMVREGAEGADQTV